MRPISPPPQPNLSDGDSSTRPPSIRREDSEKQLTKVLVEVMKCAEALKTGELITDTRVKEAIVELVNKVYVHLPDSLQEQLIVDLRRNTPHLAQQKNFPRKKGVSSNTLWIVEKLVLSVGVCCFMYLLSLYFSQ